MTALHDTYGIPRKISRGVAKNGHKTMVEIYDNDCFGYKFFYKKIKLQGCIWYAFLTYTGKGCTVGFTLYKYNNDVVISFPSIGMNKYWFDCTSNIVSFQVKAQVQCMHVYENQLDL